MTTHSELGRVSVTPETTEMTPEMTEMVSKGRARAISRAKKSLATAGQTTKNLPFWPFFILHHCAQAMDSIVVPTPG